MEESKQDLVLNSRNVALELDVIDESVSVEHELGSSAAASRERVRGIPENPGCDCTQGILIVDDTPFNIDVVEVMLKTYHYIESDRAEDGHVAVKMI